MTAVTPSLQHTHTTTALTRLSAETAVSLPQNHPGQVVNARQEAGDALQLGR